MHPWQNGPIRRIFSTLPNFALPGPGKVDSQFLMAEFNYWLIFFEPR